MKLRPRSVLAIATCSALAFFALAAPVGARTVRPAAPLRAARAVGLGKILTTADGGQIFGFDINQAGDDGVLASSQTIKPNGELLVSVETFDQDTGRILKSFAKYRGKQNSYGVDGIFAGDVGLVTHYFEPKNSIYSIRYYDVMNPVSGGKFTGRWTPPIKDVDVQLIAENQTTTTSVLYAIELKNNDVPVRSAAGPIYRGKSGCARAFAGRRRGWRECTLKCARRPKLREDDNVQRF